MSERCYGCKWAGICDGINCVEYETVELTQELFKEAPK